jgi:hypothetical protein
VTNNFRQSPITRASNFTSDNRELQLGSGVGRRIRSVIEWRSISGVDLADSRFICAGDNLDSADSLGHSLRIVNDDLKKSSSEHFLTTSFGWSKRGP